jgi:site-specific DNA-methyltransferase (adenine-specific)
MKSIPDGSIDAIITDPPYGTTACKWDSVIDFDLMWEQLNRIIKPNGAIVLFGSEPFSSALRMSNIKNYKYDWIWKKNKAANFMMGNKMPMKINELVSVFYVKQPTYNPIKTGNPNSYYCKKNLKNKPKDNSMQSSYFQEHFKNKGIKKTNYSKNYDPTKKLPETIIEFKKPRKPLHPTQKPILLMEYLIRTYTNENETVLDFTMGSGSTLVACQNTNRNGIGIEQDENYFKIATDRIEQNKYKLF